MSHCIRDMTSGYTARQCDVSVIKFSK